MTDEEKKELQVLYSANANAISDMKNRIWLVTYYIILIQVAIIGFYNIEDIQTRLDNRKGWLFAFAVLITIFGILLLKLFTTRLTYYQDIVKGIREEAFSDDVLIMADVCENTYRNDHKFLKYISDKFNGIFFWAVCLISALGIVFLKWLMWCK